MERNDKISRSTPAYPLGGADTQKEIKALIPTTINNVREMIEEAKVISTLIQVLENHDGVIQPNAPGNNDGRAEPVPPKNYELELVVEELSRLLCDNKMRLSSIIRSLYGDY